MPTVILKVLLIYYTTFTPKSTFQLICNPFYLLHNNLEREIEFWLKVINTLLNLLWDLITFQKKSLSNFCITTENLQNVTINHNN